MCLAKFATTVHTHHRSLGLFNFCRMFQNECKQFLQTISKFSIRHSSTSYAKKQLQNYKFPEISQEECEMQQTHGWGPGGSCVNASKNAVLLKHRPTNCFVQVHESRDLRKNIQIAHQRLKLAVDNHLNGDNSYSAQFARFQQEYEKRERESRERRRNKLAAYKAKGEELKRRIAEEENDTKK